MKPPFGRLVDRAATAQTGLASIAGLCVPRSLYPDARSASPAWHSLRDFVSPC